MAPARLAWVGQCLLPLLLGGCPLTDDYFIEESGESGMPGNGSTSLGGSGGAASGAGPANASAGGPGCSSFVLEGRLDHGYLLCTAEKRDYPRAQEACRAGGMRLAWLESEAETSAVSSRLNAFSAGLEVWIGATDQETEGSWRWDGGEPFWVGGPGGTPVGDAFFAWADGTPNNSETSSAQGEDCAALMAASSTWGDRACTAAYAYLCEEPELTAGP